ncbi:MAG: PQQ-binding-like beta-propeller repeat protein [Halobacteriaceae archaeon]
MTTTTTRRRFLRAAGASALAGTPGCSAAVSGLGRETTDLQSRADAQFRGGLDRLGYYPDASVPESVTVDWSLTGVNTGEHTAAKASAVPAPTGDVVIPGDSGVVFSVAPSGEVSWRTRVTEAKRGIHGTPAVANGRAYVGAYDGVLYAVDLETGDVAWHTKLGDAIGSSPAYHDGTVYVAVEYYAPSGSVFAVNAARGDVEWKSPRPTDHPHSTIAIDRRVGRLVVGSNDGNLYAWSYPDLSFEWSFATDGPIKGPVATYDGAAFFGSWDHNVYRVDLRDGALDWAFTAGDKVMSGPAVDPSSDTLYVGSHDRNLHALDATTGEQSWAFETGGWIVGCPTVTAESVLVGSYDTNCYCLTLDGEETWRVPNEGWVSSTPRVVGDGVYYAERATESRTGAAYRLAPRR